MRGARTMVRVTIRVKVIIAVGIGVGVGLCLGLELWFVLGLVLGLGVKVASVLWQGLFFSRVSLGLARFGWYTSYNKLMFLHI